MPQDKWSQYAESSSSGGKWDQFAESPTIPPLIARSPFAPKPPQPTSALQDTVESLKGLGKGVIREVIQPEGGFGNQLPPALSGLRYSNPQQAATGNRVSDMSTAVGLTEGVKGIASLGMEAMTNPLFRAGLAGAIKGGIRGIPIIGKALEGGIEGVQGARAAQAAEAAAAPPTQQQLNLARILTKAERPTGPIKGGIPAGAFPTAPPPAPIPFKTPTGISEADLQAIREGGASTRRSNAQFVQDVIKRRGLPQAPQLADIEAAVKGRAIEMEQKYPVPKFESLKDPFAAPEGTTSGYPKTPDPYVGKNVPEMQPVQSTNINRAGYHPESKTMMVEYKNGRVYEYKGVEPDTFKEFQNAESQGSYVSQNIKGKYKTNYRGSVLGKPQTKPMAAD